MTTTDKPLLSINDLSHLTSERLSRAGNPPHDRTSEILHGRTVTDPFRPLEQQHDPAVIAWAEWNTARFDAAIAPQAHAIAEAKAFLTPALNYPTESFPYKYGEVYLFWKKDPEDAHPYLRMTRTGQTKDGTDLINPNTIDPSGKTRICTYEAEENGRYIAYGLSVSGSDKYGIRVLDVASGKDLPDAVPDNYFTGVGWDREGRGFYYTYMRDDGSRSLDVRHHKLGEAFAQDRVIHRPEGNNAFADVKSVRKIDDDTWGDYEFLNMHVGTENRDALSFRRYGSEGGFTSITTREMNCTTAVFKEVHGKFLATTDLDAPYGRVVEIDPANPAPAQWKTLITGSADKILESCFTKKGKLFVNFTVDTADTLEVRTLDGSFEAQVPLPPQSVISWQRPRYMKDSFHITINGFQESGGTYEYDIAGNSMTLVKPSDCPIDLRDCVVERVHGTSDDGKLVPMTVIRHPDTQLDNTAAGRLYGYGGFNVPLTPGFSANIAHWVRQTGIYAQANLRGGGEFGRDWYEDGILANKQNVFNDMAACARELVKRGYTSPERLAIEGGSNGGLLTLACVVQQPQLYGAVVSHVPVADVLRFPLATNGSNWKSDYGDPKVEADFKVAAAYSPVHNVPRDFKHPPVLIVSDAHDDRVAPWHAYKMGATFLTRETADSQTYMRINMDGGHGAGQTTAKRIDTLSAVFAFLQMALGPINQTAYKAELAKKSAAPRAG
jgi:prolyl oligopeptidase